MSSSRLPAIKIIYIGIVITLITLLFKYLTSNKSLNWNDDLQQTALETNNIRSDFFWNNGQSLQRFVIHTQKCPDKTEWEDIPVVMHGHTYDYRFSCNKTGDLIIGAKDYEGFASTMYLFELLERRGIDVVITFWDKSYTFDTKGFKKAVQKSNEHHRSL